MKKRWIPGRENDRAADGVFLGLCRTSTGKEAVSDGWWEYFPARNIISENEKTEVEVPEEWLSVCVRLYFHSVYHDAKIYVNGRTGRRT